MHLPGHDLQSGHETWIAFYNMNRSLSYCTGSNGYMFL